jgi:hypothetical protein
MPTYSRIPLPTEVSKRIEDSSAVEFRELIRTLQALMADQRPYNFLGIRARKNYKVARRRICYADDT